MQCMYPAPRPDCHDELGELFAEPTRHPVTVVRLSSRSTTATTPGGSSASCRVDIDRPLPVAAVLGRVSLMEHDAAPVHVPTLTNYVSSWARPFLHRREGPESPIFNLYPECAVDDGWGSDEDDQRIFDQATGVV